MPSNGAPIIEWEKEIATQNRLGQAIDRAQMKRGPILRAGRFILVDGFPLHVLCVTDSEIVLRDGRGVSSTWERAALDGHWAAL